MSTGEVRAAPWWWLRGEAPLDTPTGSGDLAPEVKDAASAEVKVFGFHNWPRWVKDPDDNRS